MSQYVHNIGWNGVQKTTWLMPLLSPALAASSSLRLLLSVFTPTHTHHDTFLYICRFQTGQPWICICTLQSVTCTLYILATGAGGFFRGVVIFVYFVSMSDMSVHDSSKSLFWGFCFNFLWSLSSRRREYFHETFDVHPATKISNCGVTCK